MALSESKKKSKERLPIFSYKSEILQYVHNNNTLILIGETACGKTTQIPQYLLDGGFAKNKCIAVTQPRRVAAITIAERVAEELQTKIGGRVGYSVRFESFTSSATKIKYLTDGMLLRETISDPLLSDYSVVILDEVHERTLSNDILLGVVKLAQKLRIEKELPVLKIIITSATLNHGHLSKYFDNADMYIIPGREFKIQFFCLNKVEEDYVMAALRTVFQVHQNEEEGDILVFCTGQEEIDSMVSEVRQTIPNLPVGCLKIHPCGLYAAMPNDQQLNVFKPAPPGHRKVIFSTNIAETSVTIPGIKYVIDTGMVKAKSYNPLCGFDVLTVQRISKAQANQRAGRAGRECNGSCYRLYTVDEFEKFKTFGIPEILRSCLSSVVLQMVAIGIKNIQKFDFLDRPSDENILAAIRQLTLLGAVTENDGDLELTECGKKMVNFPLDPRFSKMIITSKTYKCTNEILTIISLLSVEAVFYTTINQRERFLEVRRKFESNEGDHIMLLNVYKAYNKSNAKSTWCHENFVNSRNIEKAISIRDQLIKICVQVGITPSSSSNDTVTIRKCLASGLFMNVVLLHKNKTFKMVEGNQKVRIHPASCLFRTQPFCCFYTELVQTSKIYMRNISRIQEEDLKQVVPVYCKDKRITGFKLTNV